MLTRSQARGGGAARTTAQAKIKIKTLRRKPLSCEVLMRLPRDFLVSLFKDFLRLEELARLDSAMSERGGRGRILEILGSGAVCFKRGDVNEDCSVRAPCLSWLGKRGVGVRELKCDGSLERGVTAEMVVAVCRNSPELECLHLFHWNGDGKASFSASQLAEVARHCPNAKFLTLNSCGVFNSGIIEAVKHMHKLLILGFVRCGDTSDALLMALSENCHAIQGIGMTDCSGVTDAGVVKLLEGCQQIHRFFIGHADLVTDVGIKAIASGCRSLSVFGLTGSTLVTDESIKILAQQHPKLDMIYLTGCNKLTDEAVNHLAKHCPQLTYMDLYGCDKLTDASLDELGESCPKLKTIDVRGCPLITQAAKDRLKEKLPELTFGL